MKKLTVFFSLALTGFFETAFAAPNVPHCSVGLKKCSADARSLLVCNNNREWEVFKSCPACCKYGQHGYADCYVASECGSPVLPRAEPQSQPPTTGDGIDPIQAQNVLMCHGTSGIIYSCNPTIMQQCRPIMTCPHGCVMNSNGRARCVVLPDNQMLPPTARDDVDPGATGSMVCSPVSGILYSCNINSNGVRVCEPVVHCEHGCSKNYDEPPHCAETSDVSPRSDKEINTAVVLCMGDIIYNCGVVPGGTCHPLQKCEYGCLFHGPFNSSCVPPNQLVSPPANSADIHSRGEPAGFPEWAYGWMSSDKCADGGCVKDYQCVQRDDVAYCASTGEIHFVNNTTAGNQNHRSQHRSPGRHTKADELESTISSCIDGQHYCDSKKNWAMICERGIWKRLEKCKKGHYCQETPLGKPHCEKCPSHWSHCPRRSSLPAAKDSGLTRKSLNDAASTNSMKDSELTIKNDASKEVAAGGVRMKKICPGDWGVYCFMNKVVLMCGDQMAGHVLAKCSKQHPCISTGPLYPHCKDFPTRDPNDEINPGPPGDIES